MRNPSYISSDHLDEKEQFMQKYQRSRDNSPLRDISESSVNSGHINEAFTKNLKTLLPKTKFKERFLIAKVKEPSQLSGRKVYAA